MNNRILALLVMFILLIPLISFAEVSSVSSSSGTYQLMEDTVLHAKPKATAKQVGKLDAGATVEVRDVTESGWAVVMNNGKKAYAEVSQMKKLERTAGLVGRMRTEFAAFKKRDLGTQLLFGYVFVYIVCSFFALPAFPYMAYRNFFKRYKPYTFEQLREKVSSADTQKARQVMAVGSDSEADAKARQLADDVFDMWTVLDRENDVRAPTTFNQMRDSARLLKQAQQLCPVDYDVVHRLNELGDVLNAQDTRNFTGAYLVLIALSFFPFAVIQPELMAKPKTTEIVLSIVVGLMFVIQFPLAYWLSQRAPYWKSGGVRSYIGKGLMRDALANAGQTTHYTTTYTNGRTTHDIEATGAKIALVTVLITFTFNLTLSPILVVTGFWRNYIKA